MYDLGGADTGREWIEVLNSGSESVNISEYKFFEGDVNHKLTLVQGESILSPFRYAIIASDGNKFKKDYPAFDGIIFDSAFSLSNDSETLEIREKDQNTLDKYSYNSNLGGAGNGDSLQIVNGIWVASRPTPGVENIEYTKPVKKVEPQIIQAKNSPQTSESKNEIVTDKVTLGNFPSTATVDNDLQISEKFSHIYSIFFGLILMVSTCLVYFIRRSKKPTNLAEEFEILE